MPFTAGNNSGCVGENPSAKHATSVPGEVAEETIAVRSLAASVLPGQTRLLILGMILQSSSLGL